GGGAFPGLRITPINTSEMEYPAGIGPSGRGLTIYGGQAKAGGSSIVQCHPEAAFMRTYHEGGGTAGVVQVSPRASLMRTYREDGGWRARCKLHPPRRSCARPMKTALDAGRWKPHPTTVKCSHTQRMAFLAGYCTPIHRKRRSASSDPTAAIAPASRPTTTESHCSQHRTGSATSKSTKQASGFAPDPAAARNPTTLRRRRRIRGGCTCRTLRVSAARAVADRSRLGARAA